MLPFSRTDAAGKRAIPGTPVFDGDAARSGYALNAMCFSFNDASNREAFVANEEAYIAHFGLTEAQADAVPRRDVPAMIASVGNVYYIAKQERILGIKELDLGAIQTGMALDDFKAALLAHGTTETRVSQ